jgi:hypothetical protein
MSSPSISVERAPLEHSLEFVAARSRDQSSGRGSLWNRLYRFTRLVITIAAAPILVMLISVLLIMLAAKLLIALLAVAIES